MLMRSCGRRRSRLGEKWQKPMPPPTLMEDTPEGKGDRHAQVTRSVEMHRYLRRYL